ncbi:MAG: type II secretion system protein [Bacilli bacterium]
MNRKGFTLIELLAIIILMGLIAVLVMPSIVDSLNKSKETSYKVLINNIKTAAETYYEECEYGDLSSTTKYGRYACTINNNTINTTIGALASTGILKVSSDKEDNLTILDPRDNNNTLNDCQIQIIKNVASNFKVTYQINGDDQQYGCPTDEDFGSE